MIKLNLPIEMIIKDYYNGMSNHNIGKKYNCSNVTIINRLKENGINVTKTLDLPIDSIIIDYQSGMTTVELGEKYDCSRNTIMGRLRKHNVEIRSISDILSFDLPVERIIDEYKNGMSTIKLGEKYNCNPEVIRDRLIKNNINVTKFINLPVKQIINEYKNGMTSIELGKKYDCNPEVIIDRLKTNNIYIRTLKDIMNIISTHVCLKCGHKFQGRPNSKLCPDCNESGYCYKFNVDCREHNRDKYNRKCFFCDINEADCDRKHSIHHVDYNKNQGCDDTPDWKLIPLCRRCHGITGGKQKNRDIWKARIIYLLNEG